jgi:hypothetical protein
MDPRRMNYLYEKKQGVGPKSRPFCPVVPGFFKH